MQQVVLIKCVCLVALLVVVGINPAAAAGVCGDSNMDELFDRVFNQCILAMVDPADILEKRSCCDTLGRELEVQGLACMCAVVLSNTAKSAGVAPEMAFDHFQELHATPILSTSVKVDLRMTQCLEAGITKKRVPIPFSE